MRKTLDTILRLAYEAGVTDSKAGKTDFDAWRKTLIDPAVTPVALSAGDTLEVVLGDVTVTEV